MAFLIIKWCTWFGYVWIIASVNESEEWNLSKYRKMDNIKCRRISDEALHVLFVSTVNLTTWQIFNIPFLSYILISQTALKLFHFGDYGESWFVPHCHARVKKYFLKDGREGGGWVSDGNLRGCFFWGGGVWNVHKSRSSLFTCVRILIGRTLRLLKLKEISKNGAIHPSYHVYWM